MLNKLMKRAISLAMVSFLVLSSITTTAFADSSTVGVSYQSHVQNVGWMTSVTEGKDSGTQGMSLRMEALKINLVNAPIGASIKYEAHLQDIGWQSAAADGQMEGTVGQSRRLEAIKISLVGMPEYSVQYQVHVENTGWQEWVADGQIAGTTGGSLRAEAIRIRIVRKTIPVKSVSMNMTSTTMQTGTSQTLVAAIMPANATTRDVTWSSSDVSNAIVNRSGTVTAIHAGTAIIKTKTVDGGFEASCTITVVDIANTWVSVSAVTIAGNDHANTITSDKGSLQMVENVIPATATNQTVTWTVKNDTGSATISSEGLLTAVSNGVVKVKATSVSTGSIYGILEITITNQVSPLASFSAVLLTQTGDAANNNVQYADASAVIAALPTEISVTLEDKSVANVPVTWKNTDTYDDDMADVYTFTAAWGEMPAGVNNNNSLAAPIVEVTVDQGIASTSPIASFTAVTLTQTGNVASSNVQYADAAEVIAALPTECEVILDDLSVVNVPVTWANTDTYDNDMADVYTFTATWGGMPAGANNNNSLAAPMVEITVSPTICGHEIEFGGFTSEVAIAGTDEKGYAIYNAAQLQHLAMHLTENAVLMNDIAFLPEAIGDSTTDTAMGVLRAAAGEYGYTSGHDIRNFTSGNFMPIGYFESHITYVTDEGFHEIIVIDADDPYTGIFDGNGYMISGLNINGYGSADYENSVGYVGLFGYTSGAEIKNLTIENESVKGLEYIGGVIGKMNGGLLTNVSTTGSGTISGNGDQGGITGYAADATISYVSNNLAIKADNVGGGIAGQIVNSTLSHAKNTGRIQAPTAGGLVGSSKYSTVEFSYNKGMVGGNVSKEGYRPVGGLVGQNDCSIISNSYNTGSVAGSVESIGGIVGSSNGSGTIMSQFVNVYNTGAVNGPQYVGGIAGDIGSYNQISNAYNTGTVKGSSYIGGIVGGFGYYYNSLSNSYNTGMVSGSANLTGSVAGFVRGPDYNNTVSACYWLAGTYSKDIGNSNGSALSFELSDSVITKTITDAIAEITNKAA